MSKQQLATPCFQFDCEHRNQTPTLTYQNIQSIRFQCGEKQVKKVLPLPELLHHLVSSGVVLYNGCNFPPPPSPPNLILKKYQLKNLGTLPALLHHLTFPNFDGRCVRLFLFNIKFGGEGGFTCELLCDVF